MPTAQRMSCVLNPCCSGSGLFRVFTTPPRFLLLWRHSYASNFKKPVAISLAFEHRCYRRLTTGHGHTSELSSETLPRGGCRSCQESASDKMRVSILIQSESRLRSSLSACRQHVKGQHRRQTEQHSPQAERRHQKKIMDPLGPSGIQVFAAHGLSGHCFPRPFVGWENQ
jgi:hypothetical protein